MTQTANDYAALLFDEDIRIGNIVWLPGAACGFMDDEFLEEVIFDLDPKRAHPSMKRFLNLPDFAEDEDGFLDWLSDKRLTGFIAEISTPIPTSFYEDGAYSSHGFGYTQHTHIYGKSLPKIADMAIEWKRAMIEGLRAKAKGGAS